MKPKNKKSAAGDDSASAPLESGSVDYEKISGLGRDLSKIVRTLDDAAVETKPSAPKPLKTVDRFDEGMGTKEPPVADQMSLLRAFIASKLLPPHIKTPEQALTIVEIGREIGLPRIASLRTIILINGMPTVTPAMMIALAHRRKLIADYHIEKSDTVATFTVLRNGMTTPHVEKFTWNDAVKLGLSTKDNYRKQPKVMMGWRAISAAMRIVFPDVIFGLYTPEEMGATIRLNSDNELDGTIVNAEVDDEGTLLAMIDRELTTRVPDSERDAFINRVTMGKVDTWAKLKVSPASWMDRTLALILKDAGPTLPPAALESPNADQ